MPPLRYYSQFQEFNLCVNFFFGCFLFFPPISAILGNLSTQNNLLIVLCREQGDDMCAAQFSSHFACVRTQTEPLSTPPAAKFLWLRLIIFLPPSPVFFFLSPPCSYPIQSPRPGCYGDREDSPGVRNYGTRSPDELFDVYCFAKQLQGESPPVRKKKKGERKKKKVWV